MKDEKLREILKIYAEESGPETRKTDILDIADSVFDRMNPETEIRTLPVFKIIGSAAVVLIALAIGFSAVFKNDDPLSGADRELAAAESSPESPDAPETLVEEENINKIISLLDGQSFEDPDFRIKSTGGSELFQASRTRFSMKNGEVSIDVRSGTDFMVEVGDLALVRVLGTSFSLKTDGSKSLFVKVFEGLVEVVRKSDGSVRALARGEELAFGEVQPQIPARRQPKVVRREPGPVVNELPEVREKVAEPAPAEVRKPNKTGNIAQLDGEELQRAAIRDLEEHLLVSKDKTEDLNQLFELYSKRGDWGSIMNQWRRYYSEITSKNNSHRQQMHFYACEASIKLFLYGNGVCRKYKSFYPDAAGPDGLKDHLKYAE